MFHILHRNLKFQLPRLRILKTDEIGIKNLNLPILERISLYFLNSGFLIKSNTLHILYTLFLDLEICHFVTIETYCYICCFCQRYQHDNFSIFRILLHVVELNVSLSFIIEYFLGILMKNFALTNHKTEKVVSSIVRYRFGICHDLVMSMVSITNRKVACLEIRGFWFNSELLHTMKLIRTIMEIWSNTVNWTWNKVLKEGLKWHPENTIFVIYFMLKCFQVLLSPFAAAISPFSFDPLSWSPRISKFNKFLVLKFPDIKDSVSMAKNNTLFGDHLHSTIDFGSFIRKLSSSSSHYIILCLSLQKFLEDLIHSMKIYVFVFRLESLVFMIKIEESTRATRKIFNCFKR